MNYGFFRVAAASLKLKVADPSYNKEEIKKAIDIAVQNDARLLVTPELSVSGYTSADLLFTETLQSSSLSAVKEIAEYTKGKNITVVVGTPVAFYSSLYDCAAVLCNGEIVGFVPKITVSNADRRWFASGKDFETVQLLNGVPIGNQIFDFGNAVLGVEFSNDLWSVNPPSGELAVSGANVIASLSASAEYVSRNGYCKDLVKSQSARAICAYAYADASIYESTTDSAFSGAAMIAENGTILSEGERFLRESTVTFADVDLQKLQSERVKNDAFDNSKRTITIQKCPLANERNDLKYRFVDPHPFVPSTEEERQERCREIFAIQAGALARRLEHIGSKGCVIGISGGLDSTLALLVSAKAMAILEKDNKDIIGVTMPGFGTTDRTYTNAIKLMEKMGVTIREISIKDACLQHMEAIGHDPNVRDITYENTQARERTQILFDLANKHNCLLVGTGDLSELAMGWCTFNGDHMSMYGVNASVPKTLIRYLVDYVAGESDEEVREILMDVLDTPVSPELLPPDENGKIAQKTEDNIGPYELHDFFLYHFIRFGYSREKLAFLAEKAFGGKYDVQTIDKWLTVFLRRFFISQFKRSCVPDGPKVGSVSLSPRGDFKMPSDASFTEFLKEN